MFTNRRPYYGLKMSATDFFREPVRYLKQSNTQESMMEKPYLVDEYPKMHLKLPDFKFKPKDMPPMQDMPGYKFRPGYGPGPGPGYKSKPGAAPLGGIATGRPDADGGLAFIDFGEANCSWDIVRVGYCTEGPIVITMSAEYFFHAEFKFVAQIAKDTIGVTLEQLPGTEAFGWDDQDYLLTFPEDAKGSVIICGFASTHTLTSQTFETVVAGMPVGIHLISGALLPLEGRQGKPATLLKSVYGDKGANCGCIEISSNCEEEECSCTTESIGYTTQQMAVDEIQTLTVIDPVSGCEYSWEIDSGGGDLSSSTGTSVDYTAPSTNVDCVNDPTITLSVGVGTCDTLSLAVTATSLYTAAKQSYCVANLRYCKTYSCDSSVIGDSAYCNAPTAELCLTDTCYSAGCPLVLTDFRTTWLKEQGCCPAVLL